MINILVIVATILLSTTSTLLSQSKMDCDSLASYFRFLTNEIDDQEEIIKRYDCMYPSYVNTNFKFESDGKQKYPNPCSPSMFRNFIIYIQEFSNFSFSIINENDSTLFSFNQQIFKSGLYSLWFEKLYLQNEIIKKQNYKGDRKVLLFLHKVNITINEEVFQYNLLRN